MNNDNHEFTRRSLRRLAVLRQQVSQQEYSVYASPVMGNGDLFVVLPEVAKALAAGDPVVALESTIVSHGMPYPQNLQTSREVEAVVRKNGAVPATIALMDGKIHVGLSDEQLARIAEAGEKASKTSRRDLASVLAKCAIGSTTVSATSWIAAQAGIAIFATGGIGGVHRGAEQTFDVSADLTELGRTEITVVCAGAKSLLDIPKTLEYLETQGVAVVGFKTNEFPAFFTPHSGQATPLRVDSAEEAAQLINKNQQISVGSGIVLAVPINTADAADAHQVEQAIQRALQDASTKGVTGRDITPFLLQRINQLTSGQSLKSNIALIKQNAAVAAQVASHLSGIKKGKRLLDTSSTSSTRVVVVGGAALDISAALPSGSSLVSATSNPGRVSLHPGGVGRNISECLARLGEVPFLISAVGDDLAGSLLLSNLNSLRIRTEGVSICQGASTAIYNSFMSGTGELVHAISDMDIISSHITVDRVNCYEREITQARMLIVDANVSRDALVAAASKASSHGVPVWFEPISIAKCIKGVGDDILPLLTYISPNVLELHAMAQAARGQQVSLEAKEGDMKTIMDDAAELVKRGANHVIVTMGSNGVLLAHRGGQSVCQYHHLRPSKLAMVRGVTGAGDSLVGGTVWGLLQGCNLPQAIAYGMAAGKLTVESSDAVSPLISASTLATSYPLTYTSSVVYF